VLAKPRDAAGAEAKGRSDSPTQDDAVPAAARYSGDDELITEKAFSLCRHGKLDAFSEMLKPCGPELKLHE